MTTTKSLALAFVMLFCDGSAYATDFTLTRRSNYGDCLQFDTDAQHWTVDNTKSPPVLRKGTMRWVMQPTVNGGWYADVAWPVYSHMVKLTLRWDGRDHLALITNEGCAWSN